MKGLIRHHLTRIAFLLLYLNPGYLIAQPQNDWENPLAVSKNTMPPHAWLLPYKSEASARAAVPSDRILSLDGKWWFNWVKNPSLRPGDFFQPNFTPDGSWSKISVPANWQTEGFDSYIFTDVEYPIKVDPPFVPKDFNPVGSYLRDFTIHQPLDGQKVYLHFGAVNSFFYCWLNGNLLGFSKDSKTPAEFDVTPYLKKGSNKIAVQVIRFCDGTYLEGQDMWKLSGIERSVYLVFRPERHIRDFFVNTGLDDNYASGQFSLDIEMEGKTGEGATIDVKLFAAGDTISPVFQSRKNLTGDSLHFEANLKNVISWNAETPYLYELILTHRNKSGKILEVIRQQVGFRRVEIKNGQLLVNGVAIKIRGVNRHEHDMVTGKVITHESMVRDLKIMKANNINAVRNSHYPNDEYWYQLCNQYGIYLVDEANIECDGMAFHPLQTLSDHGDWTAAYLDRTKRMVERDKNFTSVITWSLGNESRFGKNFVATYNWIKSRDHSRPVQYEEAKDNAYTDIFCPMYKPTSVLLEYVKEWQRRPLILSEYAHMMGNSGGVLKDDWDLINKYEQLQGGFIWDFSDQTFLKKDDAGRSFWAYGSDMGTVGATSDTSYCADGLFQADRIPHPQAFEMKQLYAPVAFSAVGLSANSIRITNRYDFTNLQQLQISWQIRSEGKTIAQGILPELLLSAHASRIVSLQFPPFEREPGKKYFLHLEATTKKEQYFLPANTVVAREQLEMEGTPLTQKLIIHTGPKLETTETDSEITTGNSIGTFRFNKNTGWLHGWTLGGEAMLAGPLLPDFWRPVTDNDIGNSLQIRSAVWKDPQQHAMLKKIQFSEQPDLSIQVFTEHFFPTIQASYFVRYTIWPDGSMDLQVQLKSGTLPMPELPRFGMRMLVNPAFENICWLGRGPFDNYADRKAAAFVDLYTLKAADFFHPYPRAQESGYRTDISWARLQNSSGKGFSVNATKEFCLGVLHFDREKIEFNRRENVHGSTVQPDNYIWLNIDQAQMGVGGDNAWGTKVHAEYSLPYHDYQYSFSMTPIIP